MNQASWSCLGSDLQLSILSSLKQQGDKDAIQAVLQTSRALRILASSLICKLEVCDIAALSRFPQHATITTIQLVMRPSESRAHVELPDVPAWLATTSAAGRRLRAITTLSMTMPHARQQPGASLSALILAIGQAFPNLRDLSVDGLDRAADEPATAFFQALGKHLPNITTLCVLVNDANFCTLDVPGIDWAACLPAGICKIILDVDLHPALLQQLAQMPSLTEVTAWALSMDMAGDGPSAVQSEACAWRMLKLVLFPSFEDVCRFSSWPRFSLQKDEHDHPNFSWILGPHSPEQTMALATAAARLATCTDIDLAWLACAFTIGWTDFPSEETASAIGVISALAPLADKLLALRLEGWTISAAILDELALALPHTHSLDFTDCIITSSAWVRLLTLTSVTRLSFSKEFGNQPARLRPKLHEATAFAASVPRAMALSLGQGVLEAADVGAWDTFLESLEMRRMVLGLPMLTIA